MEARPTQWPGPAMPSQAQDFSCEAAVSSQECETGERGCAGEAEAEKLLKESSGKGKAVYPRRIDTWKDHFSCGVASRCLEGGGKTEMEDRQAGEEDRYSQRPVPESCCTELGYEGPAKGLQAK